MNATPPPSPCCGICRMDPDSGLCVGCRRTLDEIACWAGADAGWKRAVLERIARRAADADTGAGPAPGYP